MTERNCRVYWGSHGCDLPRGHEIIGLPHVCLACFRPDDMDGYVGAPPYYGPDTTFYGEDAERLGLPVRQASGSPGATVDPALLDWQSDPRITGGHW